MADHGEMNIVMVTDAKEGSGMRVARASACDAGIPVKNIKLVPAMVVDLFGENGDVEETGEKVFENLGVGAKRDSVWVEVNGCTIATQDVFEYKSMGGGRIYFALENAHVDKGVMANLSEGNIAFEFGCYWRIGKEMGDAGTLILDGKKLTGGKTVKASGITPKGPKNSSDDDIEARRQKMLEKWGPGATSK